MAVFVICTACYNTPEEMGFAVYGYPLDYGSEVLLKLTDTGFIVGNSATGDVYPRLNYKREYAYIAIA